MLTSKVVVDGEERQSVQPGGRAAAPGELAVVQAFLNSFYDLEFDHGADLFATPESLGEWLQSHGLMGQMGRPLRAVDVRRAVTVREALRALAGAGDRSVARRRLNEAAVGAAVEIRFGEDGPLFIPAPGGGLDAALGLILAITARAMIDGSWARLKICPGEDCGWAFYDHSRNQSGRWCSMSICGGRAKARSYYRRRRDRG